MSETNNVQQEKLLPVYEMMKKANLVSETDLRAIIKKRSDWDYLKDTTLSENFVHLISYIEYDSGILKKMKNHPLRNGKEQQKAFEIIEKYFSQNLKTLYEQALFINPKEDRIFELYIAFCIKNNFYTDVSVIYDKYLQYHPDNINIWICAIAWEYNEMSNMERVEELFLKGIQLHPNNEEIYFEYFKIISKEAEKIGIIENKITKKDQIESQNHTLHQKNKNTEHLNDTSENICKENLISEERFEIYINYLKKKDNDPLFEKIFNRILEKGTKSYPNSIKLWQIWINYYIEQDDPKKVYEIFRKSIKKLKESYLLWKLIIRYYMSRSDLSQKLEDIFKEAIKFTSEEFLQFRIQYLEWSLLNKKNMNLVRKIYNEMIKLPPLDYDLISRIISLEANQFKVDHEKLRSCHEHAVKNFGTCKEDVWINFMKFEKNYGSQKAIEDLYIRAKATLDDSLMQSFEADYNIIKQGFV